MAGAWWTCLSLQSKPRPLWLLPVDAVTGLRTYLSGKEDSEDTALRSKCPRSERDNGEDEGPPDEGSRVIPAAHQARCSRTRIDKEGAGIRPFLEPRKPRGQQGDACKQFPHAQDREQVRRVAKVRQYLDDGLVVLDPDVVLRHDPTAVPAGASREVHGVPAVATQRDLLW
jgi:hypothetical protein